MTETQITAPPEKIYVIQPEWCTTQRLPVFIDGMGKQQAQIYVDKMFAHPDYNNHVMRPTRKTTVVNIAKFVEFLKVMEEERL